jgi:hypothetical protein
MSEHDLIDAIRSQKQPLGYALGSIVIPQFKLGSPYGVVDAIILPSRGRHKIAIVEAKLTSAGDTGKGKPGAHDAVVGQLLKYYAAAMRMHVGGLKVLHDAAQSAHVGKKTSSLKLLKKDNEAEAWKALIDGDPITPDAVGLHLVVDRVTNAFNERIREIRHVVHKHHSLTLRVWQVSATQGAVTELWPNDFTPRGKG